MLGFRHWRIVATLPGRGNHGIGADELSFRTGATPLPLVDAEIVNEGVAFMAGYPASQLTDGDTETIGYATPDTGDPGPVAQAEGGGLEIQETFDSYGPVNWDDPGYVGTPGPSGTMQVRLGFNTEQDPDDFLWGQVENSPGIRPGNLQIWVSDPAQTQWYLYLDVPSVDTSWPGDWTDRAFPLKNYSAPLFTSELESSHATGFTVSITLTADKAATFTAIGLPEWLTLTGGEITGEVPVGLTDNLFYFFVVATNEAGRNVAVYTLNVVSALAGGMTPGMRFFPVTPARRASAYPLLVPMEPGTGQAIEAPGARTGTGLRHFGGIPNVWRAQPWLGTLSPGERGPEMNPLPAETPVIRELSGTGAGRSPGESLLPLAYLTGEGRPDPATPGPGFGLGWLAGGLWAPAYPGELAAQLGAGLRGSEGNPGLFGTPGEVLWRSTEPHTAAFALAGLQALDPAIPLYAPSPGTPSPVAVLRLCTAGQNSAPSAPEVVPWNLAPEILAFAGNSGTGFGRGVAWWAQFPGMAEYATPLPWVVGDFGFLVRGDGSVTYTQENIFEFGGRGIHITPFEARTNQDTQWALPPGTPGQGTTQGDELAETAVRFIVPGPGESMHTANPDWGGAAIGNRYIPDLAKHPMIGPADLLRLVQLTPGRNRSANPVLIPTNYGYALENTRNGDTTGLGPEWFFELGRTRGLYPTWEPLAGSAPHGEGNPIGIEPSAVPTLRLLLLMGRRFNVHPDWEPVGQASASNYQNPGAVRSNPVLPWFEHRGRRRYIQPLAEALLSSGGAMDNQWEGLLPPAIVFAPALPLVFASSAVNPSFGEDASLPEAVQAMLDYWSYSGAHRGVAPAGYSVQPVRWFEWLRKRTVASRNPIFIPLDPGLVGFGFGGVIWTWEPLWDERPSQILSRRTVIQAGKSGRENRHGLETRQRLAMSYQWRTVDQKQNPGLSWFIARDYHRNCWMPVWLRQAELVAPFDRGLVRKELRIDKPELFRAGQNAIIWESWEQWEPLQILAVEPDRIILQNGLAYDWPTGSIVMPMARGRIETPELRYPTSTYAEAEIHFREL